MVGLILFPSKGTQTLNCGYCAEGMEKLDLQPERNAERMSYQLYNQLVRGSQIEGSDVIEFGCGRGGGARFLAAKAAPRRYVAIDASWSFILASRCSRKPAGLEFRVARAERLPFDEGLFDIAIGVEVVHLLADKERFLFEAARVLRPGGRLLLADFFYARDSSPNALSGFIAKLSAAPFAVKVHETWTEAVLAAMQADSDRRMTAIKRLPGPLRRHLVAFAGTTESPLWRQLRDGRASYEHFVLVRN